MTVCVCGGEAARAAGETSWIRFDVVCPACDPVPAPPRENVVKRGPTVVLPASTFDGCPGCGGETVPGQGGLTLVGFTAWHSSCFGGGAPPESEDA